MAERQPDRGEPGQIFQAPDVVAGWQQGVADRASYFGPATELMLDLAGLRPGSRVLDVAAGTGEQTLAAAQRVGPRGFVLAIDISAAMLEVAADAARQAGLRQVETRVVDAQQLELEPASFDAAISRCGLMLLPDLQGALARIRRGLRPGARLAALVYSVPDRNPFFALPLAVVRRRAGLAPPPLDQPGIFGLARPGRLQDELEAAGFAEVSVRVLPIVRRFASSSEALTRLRASAPILREPLAALPDDAERSRAWAEIEQALRQFEQDDGLEIPGELLLAVGAEP